MKRDYDSALVEVLRNGARIVEENGTEVILKPVPDDERSHVLDPRVLETAKKKMANKSMQPSWTSLIGVRYRPDKVSYEIHTTDVAFEERLINCGDHLIDIFIFTPEGHDERTPVLMYFHGGGFTAGDIMLFKNQLSFVAEQSGCVVVFPEYRLAPETPFPGAIMDCKAATEYVIANADDLGIDPDKIVVAGDSAGGSIANACIELMPEGTFKTAIEMYPCTDADPSDEAFSYDDYPCVEDQRVYAHARVDRLRGTTGMLEMLYACNGESLSDPRISARYYEKLESFPEMIIMTAEYDYLRLQGERFAKQLRERGVTTTLYRYCGCDHGFFDWPGIRPQTEDAALVIADVLKGLLS